MPCSFPVTEAWRTRAAASLRERVPWNQGYSIKTGNMSEPSPVSRRELVRDKEKRVRERESESERDGEGCHGTRGYQSGQIYPTHPM